jgi:hypothetical protein
VRRQGEAGAELFERGKRFEALLCIGGDRAMIRNDQVRIRAVVRSADATAQLVQLSEAEAVGAIDDDRVRARHVDARFDNRGRDQHVEALPVEVEHDVFEFAFRHLTVGDPEARFRHQLAEFARGFLDGRDLVVQEIHLAAAREFALQRLTDQRRIVVPDERFHGEAMLRRRRDDRQIAQAGHRHVQGARYRRRGQREQVDLGTQFLQHFFLAHTKAMLLIDDDEPEILELDVRLQQFVRADHHVDLTGGEPNQCLGDLLLRLEARQHLNLDRPVRIAVVEGLVVLLREQRGRREYGNLFARDRDRECGTQRDFGLAEADVAADDTVHRFR